MTVKVCTAVSQAHLPRRAIRPRHSDISEGPGMFELGRLTGTQTHHAKCSHDNPQPRLPHHTTKHELVRHQLHQARIDQDASADTIEHTLHDQRRLRPRRIGLPETQAHCHGYWRREAVSQAEKIWGPASRLWPRRCR